MLTRSWIYLDIFFWEEILEAFPDCKVILSEEDEDSWLKSFVNQLEMLESTKSRKRLLLSQSCRKMNYIVVSVFNAEFGSNNTRST